MYDKTYYFDYYLQIDCNIYDLLTLNYINTWIKKNISIVYFP